MIHFLLQGLLTANLMGAPAEQAPQVIAEEQAIYLANEPKHEEKPHEEKPKEKSGDKHTAKPDEKHKEKSDPHKSDANHQPKHEEKAEHHH